jgi:hypothetical protein
VIHLAGPSSAAIATNKFASSGLRLPSSDFWPRLLTLSSSERAASRGAINGRNGVVPTPARDAEPRRN